MSTTLKRSTTTADRGSVLCHWCREAGNGTSPYRSFADELPAGVRVTVCGPGCPEVPEGLQVFPAWPGPGEGEKRKGRRSERTDQGDENDE